MLRITIHRLSTSLLWLLIGCGSASGELCDLWSSAGCPSDFPNLRQSVSIEACHSNFDFNCRGRDCTAEYEARIQCETEHPNCCNAAQCNNAALTACEAVTQAWNTCVDAARTACE